MLFELVNKHLSLKLTGVDALKTIFDPYIVFCRFFQGTQHFKPLTFTVFGVISLISGGTVWLLPETRGNPLQDQLVIIQPPDSGNGGPTDITVRSDIEEESVPLNVIQVHADDMEQNGELAAEKS